MAVKKESSTANKSSTAEKDLKEKNLMVREGKYFYANGKRKTSVARVRMYENGKGEIVVNNRPIDQYFFGSLIGNVTAPLKLANAAKMFDVIVMVVGGGVSSQSEAIRHGVSKALLEYDPELRKTLRQAGFLTRDSRNKERKKPGLKRARRAPQWAKR